MSSSEEKGNDVMSLKNKLRGIQSVISRLHNEIELLSPSTTSAIYLQVKEERLRSLFVKYEDLFYQIFSLDPAMEDDGKVEQRYLNTIVKIKELQSHFTDNHLINTNVLPTKLPQINVPPFSGRYSEYQTFVGLFNSLIHNNNSLEKIQKLYYLRTFLQGEPLDLIKNLPLLDSSYDESLAILKSRYNNEFLIKSEHIGILLDIPSLNRSTATNLRQFVSKANQQIAALKNLNVKVDNCPIILTILLRKLDILCNREFQIKGVVLIKRNPVYQY